jgi:DNA-binding transcriptional regulator YiaG
MTEISAAEILAARDLLKMSAETLAHEANVGLSTLASFEAGAARPTPNTVRSIRLALQEAGVEFLAGEVRLKAGRPLSPIATTP